MLSDRYENAFTGTRLSAPKNKIKKGRDKRTKRTKTKPTVTTLYLQDSLITGYVLRSKYFDDWRRDKKQDRFAYTFHGTCLTGRSGN